MKFKVIRSFYLGKRATENYYPVGVEFPEKLITDANRDHLFGTQNANAKPLLEAEEEPSDKSYDDMTVAELKSDLVAKGVDFNKNAKKDELLALAKE